MTPFVSDDELAIRTATVARIRELLPQARVIHELNVEQGTVRADLAAVTADKLYLFELKSRRDTLSRLPQQLRHFHPVCHGLIVVADEKWCGAATKAGYPNCDASAVIQFHASKAALWQWPEPEGRYRREWSLPISETVPWPHRMLRLLWTEELRIAAGQLRISADRRSPGYKLAKLIAAQATGADIEKAVCRALRARPFAEADAPIFAEARAA